MPISEHNASSAKSSRVVLITGASSGIGRALAEHYARANWTVGALARRADALDSLAGLYPERITSLVCDVTDGPAMEQVIHRFALEAGSLDLVYANAGIGQETQEQAWDVDRARLITSINVLGVVNTVTPAINIMLEQGHGAIVGISSLAGLTPLPHAAVYGASKSWMHFYLESLDMDLAPRGINCVTVMPGYVRTAMVDGEENTGLITDEAHRAAKRIADGVAQGRRLICFPAKVYWLARLGTIVPRSWRINMQLKRLVKRKHRRQNATGSGGAQS